MKVRNSVQAASCPVPACSCGPPGHLLRHALKSRSLQPEAVLMYTLKKSLGQHFLKDENISRKIVASLLERPFTQLLEVGPGGGALTKFILEIGGIDFRAVE